MKFECLECDLVIVVSKAEAQRHIHLHKEMRKWEEVAYLSGPKTHTSKLQAEGNA